MDANPYIVPVVGLVAPTLAALLGLYVWFERNLWERNRKQTDILIGLHAEIVAGGYASLLQERESDAAVQNLNTFATSDRTDFVFESIKTDISILPADVIYEVVRYYRLAEQSNRMTDDLRTKEFEKQEPEDKKEFLRELMSLVSDQRKAAIVALNAIEVYSDHNLKSKVSLQLRSKRFEKITPRGE